jgi:predicted AAA+ superfamily ATPase
MVKKEDLARYLADKRNDIDEIEVKEREVVIHPSGEFISAVYGPRRAGKSFLFYSILKRIDRDRALYLNFEDIQLRDWTSKDISESVPLFHEIFGREPEYVLLDEVQNVDGWEKAVNTLYERKRFHLLLTGSSSKLLAKEISTSLRGRSLGYALLPLSFREYLNFLGMDSAIPRDTRRLVELRSKLDTYLSDGSFPGLISEKGLLGKFYDEYLDLVVYRDLVERYGIGNLGLMKFLIKNIIRSFSKELSINRLFNDWRSMRYEASKKTFYEYFSYLEDAMFVLPLKKYSRSERTSELSIPKVYLPDTGLPSFAAGYQKGRAMENSVFLELFRRLSGEDGMKLYFWRERSEEVDFVICRRDEPVELIQVTESLTRDNRKREIKALEKVGELLSCDERTIITWTGEEEVQGVNVKPLWKFLLEERH